MAPRLNYKKSFAGCCRCKSRKVKCDEKKPTCSNCSRHNLTCEYSTFTPRIYKSGRMTCKAPQKQNLHSPFGSLSPTTRRGTNILELKLLHHYSTETSHTLGCSHRPSIRKMWDVVIPQMAFEHEPLLDALLAFSAAHRITLLPNEANQLRPIYHSYMDSALQRHRQLTKSLDTITEDVAISGMLICVFALLFRSESYNTPYTPPVQWLHLSRGMRVVVKNVMHRSPDSSIPITPLFLQLPSISDYQIQDSVQKGNQVSFKYLLYYLQDEEMMDHATYKAYEEAVIYLETILIAVNIHEPNFNLRKLFARFATDLPGRFFELVSEGRPRALVILAYLFALIKNVDDAWWYRGVPEREVRGISSILPVQWSWAMAWPRFYVADSSCRQVEDTKSGAPLMMPLEIIE